MGVLATLLVVSSVLGIVLSPGSVTAVRSRSWPFGVSMGWLSGLLARFRRELPFFAVLWIALLLGLGLLDLWAGGGLDQAIAILIGGAVVAAALTPLIWLRFEGLETDDHATRRTFAALVLWATVVFLAGLVVLGILGIE